MTESAEKEPTMEEILSSIRRIISEEDEDAGQAGEFEAARAGAAAPEPEPQEADVLELTDPLQEEAPQGDSGFAGGEMLGDDILIMDQAEEAPPVGANSFAPEAGTAMAGLGAAPAAPEAAMGGVGDSAAMAGGAPGAGAMEWGQEESGAMAADRLLGDQAASAAAGAFARLARTTRVPETAEDKTLEAIVRELLRPMLKDWLDTHLPAIVEKKVREEVERIARQS